MGAPPFLPWITGTLAGLDYCYLSSTKPRGEPMYFFYYFPVGLDVPTKRFPTLTTSFSVITVFLFVCYKYLQGYLPIDTTNLIYVPGRSAPLTAFTSALLHLSYFHLIGNLIYMFVIGRYVEDRLGPARFALLFFSAAALGNWLQGLYNLNVLGKDYMGIIGASGAISGILGHFVARFPGAKLKLAYWVFMPLQAYTRAGFSEIPAVLAVALWFLIQALKGLVQLGGSGVEIAYITHISGFFWGVAFAALSGETKRGRIEGLWRSAMARLRNGDFFGAKAELLKYLQVEPRAGEVLAALARTELVLGQRDLAKASYAASCAGLLSEKKRGDAEEVYREALRGFEDLVLEPEVQLDLAFGLERSLKAEVALRAYENFQARYPDHPEAPFALLRAAHIYQSTLEDVDGAKKCFEKLVANYPEDRWADFAREELRLLEMEVIGGVDATRRG